MRIIYCENFTRKLLFLHFMITRDFEKTSHNNKISLEKLVCNSESNSTVSCTIQWLIIGLEFKINRNGSILHRLVTRCAGQPDAAHLTPVHSFHLDYHYNCYRYLNFGTLERTSTIKDLCSMLVLFSRIECCIARQCTS